MAVVPGVPVGPEGIPLILEALRYGALAYAAGFLQQSGANAYNALVARLRELFQGRRDAHVLDRYIEDPQTWTAPLQKELQDTGAHTDAIVTDAARQLASVINSQIATGSMIVQMGPQGQITQLIQGTNVYVAAPGGVVPAAPRPEKPMGMKAFEQLVKPKLIREGWEVNLTTPEKLELRLAEGWEEVYEQAPGGARERVVIIANGKTDAIPIQRHQLSSNAMKLLVAAVKHAGRQPHSLWFKEYMGPDSPSFGVDEFHVNGADAEYAREELLNSAP
jgi:hypothetical protein